MVIFLCNKTVKHTTVVTFREVSHMYDFKLSNDVVLYYTVDINGDAAIRSVDIFSKAHPNITIPNTVDSHPVLYIADDVFRFTSIKNIVFPEHLVSIGSHAFYNCLYLESVNLPGNIKSLGHHSFASCSSLKEVYFNEGIKDIPPHMFIGCDKLNKLHLPQTLNFIGPRAFEGCSSLGSITLPKSLQVLSSYAFANCNLSTITFLNDNTYISYPCFEPNLETPTIRCNSNSNAYKHFFVDELGSAKYHCEFKPIMSKLEEFFIKNDSVIFTSNTESKEALER